MHPLFLLDDSSGIYIEKFIGTLDFAGGSQDEFQQRLHIVACL